MLQASASQLQALAPAFHDKKLTELLFRYRARNWPETLSASEKASLETFRLGRLNNEAVGITLTDFQRRLSLLVIDSGLSAAKRQVVDALLDWPAELGMG